MATPSESQSRQRLERLITHRVEKRLMQQSQTPVPSAVHEIAESEVRSSLRERHRAAQVIDEVVSRIAVAAAAQPAAAKSATPAPRDFSTIPLGFRTTPEPFLPFKKAPTPLLPQVVEGDRQVDQWAELARQAAAEAIAADARNAAARAMKIKQQKQILDDQVRLRQSLASARDTELVQDRLRIEQDASDWHSSTKADAERRRNIAREVKRDREEQAAARLAKREAERLERERQEKEILERIQYEMTVEKRRQQAIKDRDVRFRDELVSANENQKRIKEEAQRREAAEEATYVHLYEARLLKQEQSRAVAWDAVKAKMQGRESVAFNLSATVNDRAAEDDRKAAIVIAQRDAIAEAKAKAERDQRRAAAALVKRCQIEQIALKNDREVAARSNVNQELEELRVSVTRDRQDAASEARRRKELQEQQRAMLEEQILLKQRQQFVVMSDEERKLNAAILARSKQNSPSRS